MQERLLHGSRCAVAHIRHPHTTVSSMTASLNLGDGLGLYVIKMPPFNSRARDVFGTFCICFKSINSVAP